MYQISIHDRARHLAAQQGIPLHAAYSVLGRIGASRRWHTRQPGLMLDRPSAPAPSAKRIWWND
jgi:hypothetical protein